MYPELSLLFDQYGYIEINAKHVNAPPIKAPLTLQPHIKEQLQHLTPQPLQPSPPLQHINQPAQQQTFIKKGRELEEYVLRINNSGSIFSANVPIVNQEVSYYAKMQDLESVLKFFRMHLENNEKHIDF